MNDACAKYWWSNHETPNSKHQTPGKLQTSNPEKRGSDSFETWNSEFVWSFGFGVWGFLPDMTMQLPIWLLIAACLLASFFFSGMEAGVFALSRLRIRQQMRAGRPSAKVLHGFLENPENFLWTIVVGNTLANFVILGWLFAVLNAHLEHRVWLAFVFIALVFLFYAFFDLLPKMLFRMYPNRLCLGLARPFRLMHIALRPLVAVVEWCSRLLLRWTGGKTFMGHLFGNREELRLAMQESAQVFSSEERAMINRVLDLQSQTVGQITVPLDLSPSPPSKSPPSPGELAVRDVEGGEGQIPMAVTVNAETRVSEVLEQARTHQRTRLPVWETRDGRRRIVGLVTLNTMLFQPNLDSTRPVAEHVKPALFLDGDLRLEVALRRMQRGGQRLAVVLGRDGREAGIISLEDILKTVFGEVKL